MSRHLIFAAVLTAASMFASPAGAVGPLACAAPGATTPSNLVGVWRVRQRDDGYEWHDVAPPDFSSDGTYSETSENGVLFGHWCVQGNALIWGFDTGGALTTYRVPLGPEPMRGFMTWSADGMGTGEVEIHR